MARRTVGDIEKIWANVEGVRKLSDRVVGVGPVGLGLDGLLTWIPAVGDAYTIGAGGWLLWQAVQAKAPPALLARMGAYLALDTATAAVPFAGAAVDTLFPAHAMAARALQKHIETTHWVEANEQEAKASGEHARHLAAMQADPSLKRLIYLHD